MSIKRARAKDFATFAAFIQENLVPSIFKAATYNSETGVLTCTDDDDNTALAIRGGSTATSEQYYFRAYRTAAGGYLYQNFNAFPNSSGNGFDVIACDNGLICTAGVIAPNGYGRTFCFMIAKTNNGKPAIIFGEQSSNVEAACKTNITHVALGDSPTMSTTTTFTPESGNQTVITPFITNADVGGKSYTPSAGYMPAHSNYGSGLNKFLLGADMYITNGYWCIKDGGAA